MSIQGTPHSVPLTRRKCASEISACHLLSDKVQCLTLIGRSCCGAWAGAGIPGQGYSGGPFSNLASAGGGGAGGPGQPGYIDTDAYDVGGAGGPGVYVSISGASVCYAGGGGGGAAYTKGPGGCPGSGNGASPGAANSGCGGGGAALNEQDAVLSGGSGVVILKY